MFAREAHGAKSYYDVRDVRAFEAIWLTMKDGLIEAADSGKLRKDLTKGE
jgi:hypothetical protein